MESALDLDGIDVIARYASITVPATGGGAVKIERLLPLTDELVEQTDREDNAKLWDLFPVECSLLETQENHQRGIERLVPNPDGVFHPKDVSLAINHLERARCNGLLFPIQALAAQYAPCRHKLELIRQRKALRLASPLNDAVMRALDSKPHFDQAFYDGNYPKALFGYVELLGELLPWSATPLVFSPKSAFAFGIAQIEGAILVNLAMSAVRLAQNTPKSDLAARTFWMAIGFSATDSVLEMRFASHRMLAKAYHYRAKLGTLASEVFQVATPKLDKVTARLKLWRSYARLIYFTQPEDAPDPEDAPFEEDVDVMWAHQNCTTAHSGCANQRMVMARFLESAFEGVTALPLPWGEVFDFAFALGSPETQEEGAIQC